MRAECSEYVKSAVESKPPYVSVGQLAFILVGRMIYNVCFEIYLTVSSLILAFVFPINNLG